MNNSSGILNSAQTDQGLDTEVAQEAMAESAMTAGQSGIGSEIESGAPNSEESNHEPYEAASPARSSDSLNSGQSIQHRVEYLNGDGARTRESGDEDQHGTIGDEIPPTRLEPFDWDELQQRFKQRMQETYEEEQSILQELQQLTEFYNIWTQTGANQENDRASKRLRTRIAYVRNSEMQLRQRQEHHTNVVEAFESALRLLGGL